MLCVPDKSTYNKATCMDIQNHPLTQHCQSLFTQFRAVVARTVRKWFARGHVVLPAAVLFLWSGLRTWFTLTRKMGEPWVSRHFPDLQPRRLLRSACHMVPLIWSDSTTATDAASERIPASRLKQIKRRLQQLPQTHSMPRSAAARRMLQAAFARSAAAVSGQTIPENIVGNLRGDRCLRDLLMTWIDLVLVTTVHPNSRNMQSSLAVHATLKLPQGDQLPMPLRRQLSRARAELKTSLTATENVWHTDALKRRMQLESSQVLTVPMAFADALQQKTPQDSP